MGRTKFKDIYKAEKKRILEKLAFLKFKKQLLKLEHDTRNFERKYL